MNMLQDQSTHSHPDHPYATAIESASQETEYRIPLRYRKMENLHILFWLFKDLAWCMEFKTLGIIMVTPTIIIAMVIAWRTRNLVSELCHNLAICFWILANTYWMVSEFFGFDEKPLFGDYIFKHLAVIPFLIGLFTLLFYYLYWRPKHRNSLETM